MMRSTVFLLTCLCLIVLSKGASSSTRLYDQLLSNYNRMVRPVLNASDPVTVALRLTVTRLADFDEDTDVLTINGWFMMYWKDEFLTWDREEYEDVLYLHLRNVRNSIWTPDIRLYNSMDINLNIDESVQALVYSNGDVLWVPPAKFSVPCVPDHKHRWSCTFTFGPWTYSGLEVDVVLFSEEMDLDQLLPSTHWTVDDYSAERQVKTYQDYDDFFPSIDFKLNISKHNKKRDDDDDDDSDEHDDSDEE